MDRCLTEEPQLIKVGVDEDHRSACWLPPDLTGFDRQVDEQRWVVAEAQRSGRALTMSKRRSLAPERAS
jgi:hypothetical protein